MEVACTAKRNFDRECKKTFATKSALSVISLLRDDSVAFGCEADMRTVDRSNQSDVNDPTETLAASDFRSAKALFVPSLKRDIFPSVACTRPPAGGVAWQSTPDGENSYSH